MGRFSERVFGWQIDAFLRKAVRCGYIAHASIRHYRGLLNDADNKLIKSVKMPTHCLHELLPPTNCLSVRLWDTHYIAELPLCLYVS